MKTKTVEYSYPTSPNAEKFGFGETGCWTVEILEPGKYPISCTAFEDIRDAINRALEMPEKWNPSFLKYGIDRIKDYRLLDAVMMQSKE